MSLNICFIIEYALILLQFFSDLQCKNRPGNSSIATMNCENIISNEFDLEFNEMIKNMKNSVTPQIRKQIRQLTSQPDFNYINYFKYDLEFVALFVISRIERAFEEINFNQFFNKISDCMVCENQNRTSRICFEDQGFRKNFIKTSIGLFDEHPLEIEKKKFEKINEFKKRNDIKILANLYEEFLIIFNNSKYIGVEMKNMIKNRITHCCSKKFTDKENL